MKKTASDKSFGLALEIQAQNAGVFISRGLGRHPRRIITSYELFFVKRGVLDIREGSTDYHVGEGESLLLFPGILHEGTGAYPPDLQYYWVHFSVAKTGLTYNNDETIRVAKHTVIARPVRLEQLFRWFINDQENASLNNRIASLLIYQMLNEVEISSDSAKLDKRISPLAYQAFVIIKTHFAQQTLSTQSISEAFHCNSDYLGRIFRQSYGAPITTYIHQTRVHHAQTLLLENIRNVTEISRICGFADIGYFRTIFKRLVGVSPSEYRTAYEKLHINTE